MLIEVTQEDIDRGHRRLPMFCPVAYAIRRQAGEDTFVSVGVVYCSVGTTRVPLSADVSRNITAFDDGYHISPFTFELDYAPEASDVAV